jgi:hypothetical protein
MKSARPVKSGAVGPPRAGEAFRSQDRVEHSELLLAMQRVKAKLMKSGLLPPAHG